MLVCQIRAVTKIAQTLFVTLAAIDRDANWVRLFEAYRHLPQLQDFPDCRSLTNFIEVSVVA